MIKGRDLLDPVLAERIGNLDSPTLDEIVNICEEALAAIFDPETNTILLRDKETIQRAAPWIWDLSRGLHYQSIYGPEAPSTIRLIAQLSAKAPARAHQDMLADRIDWTFTLTEHRIAEFVQGKEAISRDPSQRERNFPWYGRLKVGYHIQLTIEALRLLQSNFA
jgi:hypothetical protein